MLNIWIFFFLPDYFTHPFIMGVDTHMKKNRFFFSNHCICNRMTESCVKTRIQIRSYPIKPIKSLPTWHIHFDLKLTTLRLSTPSIGKKVLCIGKKKKKIPNLFGMKWKEDEITYALYTVDTSHAYPYLKLSSKASLSGKNDSFSR